MFTAFYTLIYAEIKTLTFVYFTNIRVLFLNDK
jgi:hypothetical protein